ncbi:hypothetical protein L369_00772 [Enterobacter sp. MGH 23]|nr:hypothetical protein L369_00772 [Enterobacter sp. MGH 23]
MLHNTNRNHQLDSSLQNVLFNHQNQLFECYSKLLMLRVDFAYPSLAHGGLSLLEVAVPFIELSKPNN